MIDIEDLIAGASRSMSLPVMGECLTIYTCSSKRRRLADPPLQIKRLWGFGRGWGLGGDGCRVTLR